MTGQVPAAEPTGAEVEALAAYMCDDDAIVERAWDEWSEDTRAHWRSRAERLAAALPSLGWVRADEHEAVWDNDERPSCRCGFNGTPDECRASRDARADEHERAVREQVAREIETVSRSHYNECIVLNGERMGGDVRKGMDRAARIARGEDR